MIRRLGSAIALALTISVPALAHDGDLDRGFGIGGKVFQTLPGGAFIGSYRAAIGMQSSGQFIVAASKVISATNQDFAALRVNADGSIDASFGTGTISFVLPTTPGTYVARYLLAGLRSVATVNVPIR